MKVLCTTILGFEGIAAKEIESFGGNVTEILKGKIIADGLNEEDIVSMNFSSRTLHRVCILLAHQRFSDIEEIYKIARELDYTEWLSSDKTFEVRTNREGEHNFTSMDVNRYVGQAVIESYLEDTGHRLKVNLEEPDVSIKCWVHNDYFLIGIDTTGDSLHRRDYRVYQHHAPLKSTIAAAMIMWSEWQKNKILCDPFCGSGTILIEGAYIAKNFPPNIRRDKFLYSNLKIFRDVEVEDVREKLLKKVRETRAKIYGVDISPKHIEGCKKCIEAEGFPNDILALHIQAGGRLIKKDYGRIGRQNHSNRYSLSLPPTELYRGLIFYIPEIKIFKIAFSPIFNLFFTESSNCEVSFKSI